MYSCFCCFVCVQSNTILSTSFLSVFVFITDYTAYVSFDFLHLFRNCFLLENIECFDMCVSIKRNSFENIELKCIWMFENEFYFQHERTSKKRRTAIIILWWGVQRECWVMKFCHLLSPLNYLYMSNVIKLQHCAIAVHVPHITWMCDLFSVVVVLQRFLRHAVWNEWNL